MSWESKGVMQTTTKAALIRDSAKQHSFKDQSVKQTLFCKPNGNIC